MQSENGRYHFGKLWQNSAENWGHDVCLTVYLDQGRFREQFGTSAQPLRVVDRLEASWPAFTDPFNWDRLRATIRSRTRSHTAKKNATHVSEQREFLCNADTDR